MDAQTRIRDTAALAALVQCLVRLEALDGMAEPELRHAPEVLDENRFLAARDGIHAQLLDPQRDRCVPASGRLATLVDACWPHARALGCERELAMLAHLAGDPGAARQRAIASERTRPRRPPARACRPSSRRRARSWPAASARSSTSERSTRVGSSLDTRSVGGGGARSTESRQEKGCCTPGFWTLLPRSPVLRWRTIPGQAWTTWPGLR